MNQDDAIVNANPEKKPKKCCICGPVKNCGPYLNKIFENIEKMASLFNDYSIVIYYDKSYFN